MTQNKETHYDRKKHFAWAATILGAIVALFSMLSLSQDFLDTNLALDTLLIPDIPDELMSGNPYSGRLPVVSAIC